MTSVTALAGTPSPALAVRGRTRTLAGIGMGHALEWYDWGVYAVFVPFFASQFFHATSQLSAVLASLAVFAAGFAARPLGGLVFGWVADRLGRRTAMTATVASMAAASFVIGVSPNYAHVGAPASVILVLARIVQGLACGGELPSAQTYLAEYAPAGRRGKWSSLIYIASVFGNTVGVGLGFVLALLLTDAQMTGFGWRVPFLLGGVFGLVAVFIRRGLDETEAFCTTRRHQQLPDPARPSLWREVVRHRRQAAQVVGLTVGLTVVYYTWVIAAPAYAIGQLGISATSALAASVVASVLFMVQMPLWGILSDRIGRRPVLLICTLGCTALLFPAHALIRSSAWQLGVAMSLVMCFIAAGVSILPAVYAEMFPTRIRTVGLAVPYSVAVAAFGGTAPYLQTWLSAHLHPALFTGYVAALLLVSATVAYRMPETRGQELT